MIRGILFDLGHTLIDLRFDLEEEPLKQVYQENRRRLQGRDGFRVPEVEELLDAVPRRMLRELNASYERGEIVERNFVETYTACFRDIGFPLPEDLVEEFVRREHWAIAQGGPLLPQTLETLEELRRLGYKLGLVSNNDLLPLFMRLDPPLSLITPFLDSQVCSSEVGLRKPRLEIYLRVLAELRLEPQEALFVGDRIIEDVRAPKALGMRALLTHQVRQEEDVAGEADATIRSVDQVLAFLSA